jgi:hypothetical protein
VGGFVPLDGFVLLNTSYQHGSSGHGSKSERKNLFHGFLVFEEILSTTVPKKFSQH